MTRVPLGELLPSGGGASDPPSPPHTPEQEIVLAICHTVLGRSDVGVFDDISEVAESSLLLIETLARTRQELGVNVSTQDFLEAPTVATLAAAVATSRAQGHDTPTRWPPDTDPVLSFDQERLWLEDQLGAGAVYNMHGCERLLGPLNVSVLEASVHTIVTRHEVLRTRFPTVAGRPVPMVDNSDTTWRIEFIDRRGAGIDDAMRLVGEQAAAPFDLAQGPLLRCLLVRLDDTEHLFSVTAHHIVCDAWSVGLFVRELAALYAANGDAAAASLPELPIQYRDYALRQRHRLSSHELDRQLSYWRGHLDGAPAVLALPTTHRLVPAKGEAGRKECVLLHDLTPLHQLCRTHSVTPFMVLLACLSTVLGRWSGQQDVVIGVPIADRSETGTQPLIGFFVNTLPFRVDLSGEPTFPELLARVRRIAHAGYANAKAPIDMLVKELHPARNPLRTPLFQVVLNIIEDNDTDRLGNLTTASVEQPVLPGPFDISVTAQENRNGTLAACIEFDSGRYEHTTITALSEQLGTILRAVVADPEERVLDHPLTAPDDDCDTAPTPPRPSAHLAVHHAAAVNPNRVAVIDDHVRLSYHSLDKAARRVAKILASRAGPRPDRIGVVRRPTAAFVAAVLGCLWNETAYTIVEPGNPDVPRMLGITTLLDVAADGELSPGTVDIADTLTERDTRADSRPPQPVPKPPTDWAAQRFTLDHADQFAVLSHSPGQLMCALSAACHAGGTLVLTRRMPGEDPDGAAAWLRDNAITVLVTTPPLLRAITRDCVASLPTLRYAFVENGGDLLIHDVEALRRAAPRCQCVGTYRTRQDGTPVAAYSVPDDHHATTAAPRVPLGTEVDTTVQLLHASGAPADICEAAEICFGTTHTGDLGRRLPDGTLQLVDVPGDCVEAVAALREAPGVRDALVTDHIAGDGVVATNGYVAATSEVNVATLHTHLARRLPVDLIPDHLVVLNALPLTPQGAYDLNTLPDPIAEGTSLDGYVAQRTPMEQQLTTILKELLNVDQVGVHDGFFEMGGFSLLATQLISRIREQFDVDLSLRDVFESPTVDGLSKRILIMQAELTGTTNLEDLLDELDVTRDE